MKRNRMIETTLLALNLCALFCAAKTPAKAQMLNQGGGPINQLFLPDLVVSEVKPVYVRTLNGPVRIADKVRMKITNQGNAGTGGVMMMFQWNVGYGNETLYYYFFNIAAGQSYWIEADSKGYDLWAPQHQFRLTLDLGNYVPEWDETNNVYDRP